MTLTRKVMMEMIMKMMILMIITAATIYLVLILLRIGLISPLPVCLVSYSQL